MTDFGIAAYGAYVPRLRIARSAIAKAHEWMAPGLKAQSKGSRSFKSWAEDAVTMAVEASRSAIRAKDISHDLFRLYNSALRGSAEFRSCCQRPSHAPADWWP